MPILFYYGFLIVELCALILVTIFLIGLIYSSISGAPYVATDTKKIDEILRHAHLKKGEVFVELGCGDGRVVRRAVHAFGVQGIGIDINPVLLAMARFFARKQNSRIRFKRENIHKTNLQKTNVLYLFLMPQFIEKLLPKFKRELPKNALIISHGFTIPSYNDYLEYILPDKQFSTYYYRLP